MFRNYAVSTLQCEGFQLQLKLKQNIMNSKLSLTSGIGACGITGVLWKEGIT